MRVQASGSLGRYTWHCTILAQGKGHGHHLSSCAGEMHHHGYQNHASICDAAKEEETKMQSQNHTFSYIPVPSGTFHLLMFLDTILHPSIKWKCCYIHPRNEITLRPGRMGPYLVMWKRPPNMVCPKYLLQLWRYLKSKRYTLFTFIFSQISNWGNIIKVYCSLLPPRSVLL